MKIISCFLIYYKNLYKIRVYLKFYYLVKHFLNSEKILDKQKKLWYNTIHQ